MSVEDQLKSMFGEEGLKNLKAHAETANLSLASFIFMAQFEPVALLELLQSSMLNKTLATELDDLDEIERQNYIATHSPNSLDEYNASE